MSNSPLVSYTKLSPNHSGKRKHAIDTISIHCMAGNLSVERCGELFQNEEKKAYVLNWLAEHGITLDEDRIDALIKERQASSNYGIGSDGRIGLYVDEANRSWCTSSASNDNRAVTIEVANTVAKDPWPVSDAAYKSLIDLLVDICQRNGIPRLLWEGDKNLVGQVDRQNMTVHRWFAAKACPGDWLYSRHGQIAAEVNKRLEAAKAGKDEETMDTKQLTSCADTGDNPSAWAKEATDYCKRKGIFAGDGAGNYGWQKPITREATAQIIYNLLEAAGMLDKLPDVK